MSTHCVQTAVQDADTCAGPVELRFIKTRIETIRVENHLIDVSAKIPTVMYIIFREFVQRSGRRKRTENRSRSSYETSMRIFCTKNMDAYETGLSTGYTGTSLLQDLQRGIFMKAFPDISIAQLLNSLQIPSMEIIILLV